MSIVTLKKISLCGRQTDQRRVLQAVQALGCLHLLPLRPPPAAPEQAPSARPEETYQALRYLLDCPTPRRPLRDPSGFDLDQVVAAVLTNRQQTRDAGDSRDFLVRRIADLAPWGEFNLPPLADLAGQRLWFYVVPHDRARQLTATSVPWQVVHRDHQGLYVVAIAPEEPPLAALPVARLHLGARPLSELQRELEQTELYLEDLAAERAALTRWVWLLTQNLAQAEDRAALRHANAQTLTQDGIFAVQGWVAAARVTELRALAERESLALLVEDPAPTDNPPTLLRNPPTLAGGEELVKFFQTPAYRSWDPSPVLFFSFALFFAMILADAGYALLLLLGLLLGWRALGRSATGRRLRPLGLLLCSGSLLYGMLAGSYFGLAPPPGSALAAFKWLDMNDYPAMMQLSITVGVLHVALANALLAARGWGRPAAYVPLGWMVALFGGLALWLGWLLGPWLLAAGLLLVFVFSSERPLKTPVDGLWRALDGVQGLLGISKAFGDVLSYMRLFALGLASASLAVTFNQLARDVAAALPGIGLLFSLLVLLLGHTLNLALSLMSGVVHGLRLNYIEFYNWGLSGEGHPFRAFAKKENT